MYVYSKLIVKWHDYHAFVLSFEIQGGFFFFFFLTCNERIYVWVKKNTSYTQHKGVLVGSHVKIKRLSFIGWDQDVKIPPKL